MWNWLANLEWKHFQHQCRSRQQKCRFRQRTLDKNLPSGVFFSKETHQRWAPDREWIPAALVTPRNVYQLTRAWWETPVNYNLSIWRHNRAHDLSSSPRSQPFVCLEKQHPSSFILHLHLKRLTVFLLACYHEVSLFKTARFMS